MKESIFVVLLLGSIVLPLSARNLGSSSFTPILNDTEYSDTGQWLILEDNMGRFLKGDWPSGSGHNYLFGAGYWIGVLDPLRTRGDTAVSWSYNPNSGQSEFCPTTPDGDAGRYLDSLARIYDSKDPQDTTQWPERDSLGRAIIVSDQELWTIDNDLGPFMVPPDSAIGVQVIRRTYAWDSPGPWGAIFKVEFDVKNVTGRWGGNPHTLSHMNVGFCVDADIGNESGSNANDLVYLDRTPDSPYPNLAVQYQLAQEPGWSIPPPYFIGIKFVPGPLNNTGDTIKIRSDSVIGYPEYDHDILPGQPLGMTAFQIFTIDVDPSTASDRYLELSGRYYRTPTIYSAYQKDTFGPADKRFLLSCGPFDLANDSSVTLTAEIIGGLDSAQILHNAELVGVETPSKAISPRITGIELYPVAPNPVTGSALIRYLLPAPFQVSLKVYDISGRLVKVLDERVQSSGSKFNRWDGKDESGRFVPSGIYFIRLEAGNYQAIRQTVVVR